MKAKRLPVKVREAVSTDIPALVALDRAAYPVLASENVVWGEAHLRSHQRIFPQRQLVAEVAGRIVGAVGDQHIDLGVAVFAGRCRMPANPCPR